MEIAETMSNSLDRETFSTVVLAVSELYDPKQQLLLELSNLPEEPTESRH